jgi:hypothetical protein
MKNYLINFMAICLSLVIAIVLIMLVQFINLQLFPLPDWVDTNNPDHLAGLMASLPIAALLMVELSYILGSFGAGLVLGKLIRGKRLTIVLIAGGLLTIAGIINLLSVPHPWWLAGLSTLTYIPMVYLGNKVMGPELS